jgi:uncharacterized membrane protein YfcA
MPISLSDSVLLIVAGLFGGVLNAVAGGGTFLIFPALVFIGIPSVAANQTSTIAVFPGQCASFWAYRKILAAQTRMVVVLGMTSLLGGGVGAVILRRILRRRGGHSGIGSSGHARAGKHPSGERSQGYPDHGFQYAGRRHLSGGW